MHCALDLVEKGGPGDFMGKEMYRGVRQESWGSVFGEGGAVENPAFKCL